MDQRFDLANSPPVRAHTMALFVALTTIPLDDKEAVTRAAVIDGALDRLRSLRIDASSLVRFGLYRQVSQILIALLVLESGTARPFTAQDQERAAHWRKVLGLPAVAEVRSEGQFTAVVGQHFARVSRPVRKWIENAPLQDVVRLDPPTPEELLLYGSTPDSDEQVVDQYRWATDRLLEGDLSRWKTSSLHLEYRWQAGKLSMLFAPTMYDGVQIDAGKVAMEIAQRAVDPTSAERPETPDLLYQLQDQARSFLRQGRHTEAAALFEFYGRVKPEGGYADNNRGFCLLPVMPDEALEAFERARRANFARRGILAYNFACALLALGRESEAVELLEYYWQREQEPNPEGCTLWRRREGAWELYEEGDIRSAVCRLAREISADLSNGRSPIWITREESLAIAA